jgi:pSer/pThr/pTyr-binding forkhead associated (FHA) protein
MAMLIQLIDDVVANKFELRKGQVAIGRHPSSDIQIDDSAVSSKHASLLTKNNEHFPQFNEYYLTDEGSTNGTYINDQRINGSQRLRHNDLVRIAWNQFKFVDDNEAAFEKTAHIIPNM